MPLLSLSLAFIVGILLASQLPLPALVWFGFSLAAAGAWYGLHRFRFSPRKSQEGKGSRWRKYVQRLFTAVQAFERLSKVPCLLLLTVAFAGAARWQVAQPHITPAHIAYYNDGEQPLVVVGVVQQMPEIGDNYTSVRLQAESIRHENNIVHTPVSGLLLARLPTSARLAYGDRVVLTGMLQTPPEDEEFSYAAYLARQGVYSYMPYAQAAELESGRGNPLLAWVYGVKSDALARLYRYLPDPEVSLLAGILLGVENGIPASVERAFQDTGTSHIIAISGFNITIVAGLFTALFGRLLGRKWGAVAAALGIAIYTVLVGADAAVVRAALMGGLALGARQLGRRQDGLNSLGLTAALMAAFNPNVLWDVGFQLSFAATLGLVWYAGPLQQATASWLSARLPKHTVKKISGPLSEFLLLTIAAQITTLPLLTYYFRRIPLTTLPANILILPVQPAIMVLGGLSLLLGLLADPLGKAVAYLCYPFLSYTIRLVEWFAAIHGTVWLTGRLNLAIVLFYYLVLLWLTLRWSQLKTRLPRLKPVAAIAALALGAVLVWQAAMHQPDGRLHVVVMDVGMGEGLLLQSPEGRYVLVNGGERTSQLSHSLGRWLPLFHRQLDYLVVASSQQEQVAALVGVVPRFPPASVLWAGTPNASGDTRYLQQVLAEEAIPIIPLQRGHTLDLGQGASLQTLAVSARGAILLLQWRDFRLLLPLGVDFESMEATGLGAGIGPLSALLLADSGYGPANPPLWLDNLQPQLVLLSVRAGNLEGLPSPGVLESLDGYNLLRTDHNGWLHITTDGTRMWLEAERDW